MRGGQTPYHKRVAHRLEVSRARQIRLQENRFTQVDSFMQQFDLAYREYYQDASGIAYKGGWYYLHGRRYRHANIEKKLAMLLARIQEQQSPNPDMEDTL